MDYAPVVKVLDAENDHSELGEDLVLSEEARRRLHGDHIELVALRPGLDLLTEVAVVAVLHDDCEGVRLCPVHFLETDNVGVIQHFQNPSLLNGSPLALLIHMRDVDLFHDKIISCVGVLDAVDFPERTSPNCVDVAILRLLFI